MACRGSGALEPSSLADDLLLLADTQTPATSVQEASGTDLCVPSDDKLSAPACSVIIPARSPPTSLDPASLTARSFEASVEAGPVQTTMEIPSSPPIQRLADRLETPELDDRSYRVIRLPNQLEALLVHDPETDKASAAMDVNVGSFSDREDMPGIAHAVEHLLFMGTEKYPKENAYREYLTAHSGHSNAYTASTSTNYYFELAATDTPSADPTVSSSQDGLASSDPHRSPLYGALDRFAQFFVAPLFLASTLDRELQAVHSENKKNLQSDGWRLYQLSKSTSNPRHPFCHFSTGNLETLRDQPKERGLDVRQEFIRFHGDFYSSNRMKLVVLGRQSLDELESWVGELFSGIPNKDLPRNRWDEEQPLTKKELLTQCFAKPVMDCRLLELSFPFMDEEYLYETQPGRYLSHLIGHEGPGSILAYIKDRGWASGLSAGSMQICPGSSLFEISVRLTEDGLKNYKAVVKVIFQYISLLRETSPQEWIFDEMKGMAEVNFRFKQKSPASDFTSKVSSVMQKPIPRTCLLSGSRLLRKFDPHLIGEALQYLRSDNFRLSIISHDFTDGLEERERWYGTEYRLEKIPSEDLAEIIKAEQGTTNNRLSDLHLPQRNEFIPTRLEVEKKDVKQPLKAPKLIRNDVKVRTWWKKDDRFWVPKGYIFIQLKTPLVESSPENGAKTALYSELVTDALVEYSYDADIAGLGYVLGADPAGLQIHISGYNDKMAVLLEKVLMTMRDLQVKPDRFTVVKERMLEEHQNWEYQEPFRQVGEYTSWLNSPTGWINEQYLAEIPHLTASDIQEFFPQLLRQVHIEMLVHGNLEREEAIRLSGLVESRLGSQPLPRSQWNVQRSLILPEGSDFTYPRTLKDAANVNHGLEYFLFVGLTSDPLLRAKLMLVAQITEEPAFDQLRTKEQLGYVVFTGQRRAATTMGYKVIIQSEQPPEYLEERIDAFLSGFAETLASMTTDEFNGHKRSLITKRLEKLKNLGEESRRFWAHIENEYLDFEQADHDASFIEPLSQADIVEFYNQYINPSSAVRSKLAVHLHAQASAADEVEALSPEALKEQTVSLVDQYLTTLGLASKSETLQQRLDCIELGQESDEAFFSAIERHLTDDLSLDKPKAEVLLDQGRRLMNTVLHKTGVNGSSPTPSIPTADGDLHDVANRTTTRQTVIFNDVHDFKAKMLLSAGVRPVKELGEFEETKSKL